jgi:F-type H+-transporting ATPase subunit a
MEEHSFLYGPVNRLLTSLFDAPPVSKMSPRLARFFFPDPRVWLPDHVIMAALLTLILAVILIPASRKFQKGRPSGLQNFLESLVAAVRTLLEDVIDRHAAEKYLPMIGAFTFFILLSNLMGLFFFLVPPTTNMNTNLALAVCSFVFYNVEGFRHAGPKYVLHFAGPKLGFNLLIGLLFGLFFFVIELVSHFARIVSLTLRLTGNISGEHLATGIFSGISPIGAPMLMMALGIIGAIMQTFIFVMLSIVYVAGATVEEEH